MRQVATITNPIVEGVRARLIALRQEDLRDLKDHAKELAAGVAHLRVHHPDSNKLDAYVSALAQCGRDIGALERSIADLETK